LKRIKIAFICADNTGRSQVAEALCRIHENDVFLAFSAGTHPLDKINTEAVKAIKELYKYDMTKIQKPKALDQIKPVDIVITLNVGADTLPFEPKHMENWDINNPSKEDKESYIKKANTILSHITQLKKRLADGEVVLK